MLRRLLDDTVSLKICFRQIEFWGKYIENRAEYFVAGVWVAEAHLMSSQMIWVEDSVLVFDWRKVLE